MKLTKGTFCQFPAQMVKGMKPNVQLVFAWLCFHGNDEGECFPSLKLLSEETGFSRPMVVRAMKELVNIGYVKRTSRKKSGKKENDTSFYEVILKNVGSIGTEGRFHKNLGRFYRNRQVGSIGTSELNPIELNPITKRKESGEKSKSILPVFPLSAHHQAKVLEILGSDAEVEKFVAYWTEPNTRTGIPRWKAQDFFDVARRAGTWARRRDGTSQPLKAFTPSYD